MTTATKKTAKAETTAAPVSSVANIPAPERPTDPTIEIKAIQMPSGAWARHIPPYSSIAAKMVRVATACGYVQKDAVNQFHKYKYASAEKVLGKFNEALAKEGLFISNTKSELVHFLPGNGGEYTAVVRLAVVISDDEGMSVEFSGLGQGSDKTDKAVMKANTAAYKYMLAAAFSISWGDDPEADDSVDWDMYIRNCVYDFNQAQSLSEVNQIALSIKSKMETNGATEEVKSSLRSAVRAAKDRFKVNGDEDVSNNGSRTAEAAATA